MDRPIIGRLSNCTWRNPFEASLEPMHINRVYSASDTQGPEPQSGPKCIALVESQLYLPLRVEPPGQANQWQACRDCENYCYENPLPSILHSDSILPRCVKF